MRIPAAAGLVSFEADIEEAGVNLTWASAWEDHTLGFNVYRKDGTDLAQVNERLILATGSDSDYGLFLEGLTGGEFVLEEIDADLNRDTLGGATAMREAAPSSDLATTIAEAGPEGIRFETGSEAVNVLVTGVDADAEVIELGENPVRLRPTVLETGGVYFRAEANRELSLGVSE